MELNTAMRILQVVCGLILVGYLARVIFQPTAWKPKPQDVDEYLRRVDPDYTPRKNDNLR